VRPLKLFAFISLAMSSFIGSVPAALVTAQQGRDEGQFTIGVDVDLVVFNVTVTDSRGRHVSGLKQADFQLTEGNRLQAIKLFNAEDVPASVGLIIDNSGSMIAKRADVAKAALAFAGASNSEDEVFVVNFNEKVYLGLPPSIRFTNDLGQIRSALLRTAPDGLTALYDALAAGIEHLKTGTRHRKALVVLSDGGDNASRRRLDDVLQMAQRSSATIYTIGIYEEANLDRNPGVLRKIAQSSGGRAYFPRSLRVMEQVWLDIAGGIRSQYTIGYHSSNPNRDGMFRKVKITASRNGGRGLRVTTREGYVAPADTSISR
jgi:Ca-activated chloride channel family protein